MVRQMTYFSSEQERKESRSTCYFEFQKGKFKNKFWLNKSLYLHGDVFDTFKLSNLFSSAIENFSYYAITEVSKEQWISLVKKSQENEQWKNIIEELMPWVEECFIVHECFTICGI